MSFFPAPEIVILDNDGTLVPSHEAANPSIQRAFAEFCRLRGIDAEIPSDARIRELTGQPGEVFYRSLLPPEHRPLAAQLRAFCLKEEVEAMREGVRFYPGLEEMLEALRLRGVRLAVATHGGQSYIQAVGERLGYDHRFDRVFYHGYDGLVSKAQMARRALEELGPGEGIFVGDRRADAEAARSVGIPFIGCLYGYGDREELDGAAVLVETPEDLARLLVGRA